MAWMLGRALLGGARNLFRRGAGRNKVTKAPGSRMGSAATGYGAASFLGGNDLSGQLGGGDGAMGAGAGGNVIPIGRGSGGGGGAGASSSAEAATSMVQDYAGNDPMINQLQDIERVLVKIHQDTSLISSGFSGTGGAKPPPDENAIRGMFGGGKGGGGAGSSASLAAGLGGAALGVMLAGEGDKQQEDIDAVEEGMEDWGGTLTAKMSQLTTKWVGKITELGGVAKNLDVEKFFRGKDPNVKSVLGEKDKLKKPKTTEVRIDKGNVGITKDGVQVRADKGGTLREVSKFDGELTTKKVNPSDLAEGGKITVTNQLDDAAKLADKATMAKSLLKNMGKYGLKQIPVVGAVAGAGLALWRLFQGDIAGAAIEGAGVAVPSIAGGLTVDLGLLARDMYNDMYGNPDGETTEEKFPHDADMINMPDRFKGRYGAIKDYIVKKLKELQEGLNEDADEAGNVEKRPEIPMFASDTTKERLAKEQEAWDEKYGKDFKADGTPKVSKQQKLEASLASDLESAEPIVDTDSMTLETATTTAQDEVVKRDQRVVDRQIKANQELATAMTSMQTSTGTPPGGSTQYIGVIKVDDSTLNPDSKLKMSIGSGR